MLEWLRFWKREKKAPPRTTAKPPPLDPALLQDEAAGADPRFTAPDHSARETGNQTKPPGIVFDPTSTPMRSERKVESDVQALIRRLANREANVRTFAAETLGGMGLAAREAIAALLVAGCDINPAVRKVASEALEKANPDWPSDAGAASAVPALLKELWREWNEVSQAARLFLARLGAAAVPRLSQALEEEKDGIRQVLVARTLGTIGPNAASAVPQLAQALASEYTHVRQAAAEALASIGPAAEPAARSLALVLLDWQPMVRQAAARALARVGKAVEGAIPALIRLLPDQDEKVRDAAAEAIVQIGPPAVPSLLELLQMLDATRLEAWLKEKMAMAQWYSQATESLLTGQPVELGFRPDERKLDEIRRDPVKAFRNANWSFCHAVEDHLRLETARVVAVRILGKMRTAEAVPSLLRHLDDRSLRVRIAAVTSLGLIGEPARAAIPFLVGPLTDDHTPLRKAALDSLRKIDPAWAEAREAQSALTLLAQRLGRSGDEAKVAVEVFAAVGASAVPILVTSLRSQDRVTREAAATALGAIGPDAREACPALTEALQDSHTWVRNAAAWALQQIQPAS